MKPRAGDLIVLKEGVTHDHIFMEVVHPLLFDTNVDNMDTIRFKNGDVGLVLADDIDVLTSKKEKWMWVLTPEGTGYTMCVDKIYDIL